MGLVSKVIAVRMKLQKKKNPKLVPDFLSSNFQRSLARSIESCHFLILGLCGAGKRQAAWADGKGDRW